jgi:glutamate synthase domain-containing protein 3
MPIYDIEADGLRGLNEALHALAGTAPNEPWEVVQPKGSHAIAVGLDAPIDVTVKGSTGYYCGGMNKQATIRVAGRSGRAWPRT